MASSKTTLSVRKVWGKTLTILGYSLEIFLLIGLIVYISTGTIDAAITFFVLMVLCSLLIVTGEKIKQRIIRFNKYVVLISHHNTTSLDLIALKTSQSIDFVRNDLQKMIDKKFFVKAYIDNNTNEIIVSTNPAIASVNSPTNTKKTKISCNSCGAANQIVEGQSGNCEYCGSPL